MPVTLLNNYPEKNLHQEITKKDGTTLYGESWVYQQFLNFNKFQLLEDKDTWFLKHDYNLSRHPASKGKVEGQIDFLLLSKYGILIIEVKGGGLRVDDNDQYFSFNKENPKGYKTQNPFNQAKEYTHTLKELIDEGVFVYRAVVLPYEAGFQLKGPQLVGYKNLLFSKKDFANLKEEDDKAINKLFHTFLLELAKSSRRKILKELNPGWSTEKINKRIFEKYPELSSKKIKSLKSQLFPISDTYGYNPERINSEIILKENYETLKGLRRNRKVIIQGSPGTGKTVLAKKFLAENILKQQKGVFFCGNKLIKSKIEHSITRDYNVDDSLITFKVYSENIIKNYLDNDIDFIIFDEAQEYFNKGLFELIEKFEKDFNLPKFMVLYDPKQTIINNFNDISFYTDFYIENGFTHYLFDETYRCGQNQNIITLSNKILHNNVVEQFSIVSEIVEKLKTIKEIISEKKFTKSEQIILIHSFLIEDFKEIVQDYFHSDLEELVDSNINIPTNKIRFTTPIKYRGIENKAVYLITDNFRESSKVQNYVAVTRAMEQIKIILWQN